MTTSKLEPLCIMHFVCSMGIGGAEKLAYDMIGSLPSEKFRPIVVCVGEDGPLADRFRTQGYTLYHRANTRGETWRIVSWIRDIVRKERVAVIHAHQYNPMHYSVLATLGNPRITLVYTEHGRIYPEVWNWKRYLTNRLFAMRLDHIVSISRSTRGSMTRYDNFPGHRIAVIHNGTDLEQLNPEFDRQQKRRSLGIGEKSRVIGTASRLEEVKNIPMMLRGYQRVLDACPDTVLLVAGRGSQAASLEALARELGIDERVRFLGLRSDLPELFKLMEVFLLVSFTEGISLTLLEAMGSGVPAVVTRAGGNPEVVIDGVTGHLVEIGDDETLSLRVIELLNHSEKAAQLGASGRDRVRSEFSFRSMMDRYLKLYQEGKG
ncbi:MAG TPA: glycosyltransferase [Geomonas sp.]